MTMAEETRTVLITGVTRGLGRSLALRLAGLGHLVIGCGRTAAAVEEMQRLLGEPHGVSIVDVASAAEVDTWARRVLARHPPVDLLVNNAGVINANAPLWEVPPEELSRVIDVNLKGTAYVLRAFLPSMLDRGRGVLVNFSSGWGKSTSAEVAPYCATKWGIEGMTKALAEELPPGLAAVAVNPGVIHTAMLESCFGQSAKSYPGPERWAERAVPFLLGLGPKDNGRSVTVPGF
jgi:NAD(P)-dependent dehydrogenase (short-subunit alcohol dehydrogenase family)